MSLYDKESGEVFAECPMPDNPANFLTAVEPVVDSSRYFVLKIVDPSSKRHAFIGLGFRERTEASDFNAALDEHRQYLRRKKEAEASKAQYEASEEASRDYRLKEGEKIHIKIKKSPNASAGNKVPVQKRLSSGTLLPPPSFGAAGKLAPPPPPAAPAPAAPAAGPTAWVADFESPEEGGAAAGVSEAEGLADSVAAVTVSNPEGGADGFEDDQWGDFES